MSSIDFATDAVSGRLTGAALDRLTHRCQIIETTGESYRLKDHLIGSRHLYEEVSASCKRKAFDTRMNMLTVYRDMAWHGTLI